MCQYKALVHACSFCNTGAVSCRADGLIAVAKTKLVDLQSDVNVANEAKGRALRTRVYYNGKKNKDAKAKAITWKELHR
jgi:hypothetical protein